MQDNKANEFYDRIVEGKDYNKTITLEHGSGAKLEDVQMHPVDKQTLAYVVQKLPEEMFDAVEEADNPDEAEEMIEESEADVSLSAMSDETVDAFEKLATESLVHPQLTNTQMADIIDSLDFAVLFEIGGEVIDMSFSKSGAIKDFHAQE